MKDCGENYSQFSETLNNACDFFLNESMDESKKKKKEQYLGFSRVLKIF